MLDTNHTFENLSGTSYDRPLNLEVLGSWSNKLAEELAAKEGIELTPAHWDVIEALRNHYQEYGPVSTGRSLLQCMESEFIERGGKKYLYSLFPRGPVNQASRIAGLPLPPHSSDPAFGSVM